jgi:hypothetical protein
MLRLDALTEKLSRNNAAESHLDRTATPIPQSGGYANELDYDIAIVGGGIIGNTLAVAILARA